MYLKKLSLINFKNYTNAEISLSRQINCFTGNNGEGKTNLLDAIYYLSFCKSFFNPIDSQNILRNAPFFVIQGFFSFNGNEEDIYCAQKRNQKKQFKRNKKEYERLADHIGLLPMVMISPADSELIEGGSENRRKFIDAVISQYDREYLDNLITYNRVLSQRNALLKLFSRNNTFDLSSLELWDVQLIELGNKIHEVRKDFIFSFIPLFQQYYKIISNEKEQVSLVYKSHLSDADFSGVLQNSLKKDRALEYTTVGTHKDDIDFLIDDFPVKKFASQGQQKSYLISLKLAQFDFIKNIKKITPLLLLDDIYDKLDKERVTRLIQLVSKGNFGQLFITDTQPERIEEILNKTSPDYKMFIVEKGCVEEKILS